MLKKLRKLSLKVKFNGFVALAMLLCVVLGLWIVNYIVTNQVSTHTVKKDLETGYEILDERYPGAWRKDGNRLYKGDRLINGNFEIVDYIAQFTGGTVTIFSG